MKLAISKLKIYVLKNYKPGSCEYDAILDHEHQHAQIARKTIMGYLPRIQRRLADEINRLGAVRDISMKRAFDKVFSQLRLRMKPTLDQMGRELKRANAAIDTPES